MPGSLFRLDRRSPRLASWLRDRQRRRFWRQLTRALHLKPRGADSADRQLLTKVSTRLEIEWYARDTHPWDADLPSDERARRFTDDSLAGTVAAIRGAFERFPEVDAIEIRVLAPRKPHAVLFSGVATRSDAAECSPRLSPAMTLKLLGIEYLMVDGRLEPIR